MAMRWCFSDLIHDRPIPMLQLVLDIRMMRLLDLYLHRRIFYGMGYFFAIYFYDSFGVELVFVSAINEDLHNGLLVMGLAVSC